MAAKYRYNLSPYNIIRPDDEHGEEFEAAEGILSVVIGGDEIPVSEYRNFYIDHKQDGRDWLGFTLAVDSELYRGISEETKVRYRGVDYLCKKISDGHIECEIDLDFLKKGFHETFISAKPLSSLLADILPVGWTAHGAVLIHGSPTIELETCTDLDILTEAQTEYRCWFSWNHEAKICTVVSADAVVRTGEYVTDELNLRTLSFKGSSVNFCTRLYAYGKSGVSIDSVNGGKKYIDDFSYSSKLIVGYFKCDYELPANILKAAQYELSLRSHPERSYECDVVDLAKLSDEYDFLDFQLHRTVTLIDTRRGINVDHRIVEYVEYPDEPARNTVTLARAVRKMAQIKEVIKNSVDEVKIQIAEVNAAVAQDVATIQANISEINASVNTVANDVATLNTKTASLSSRQDRTETAQASLTQTVASQGATINGVVMWQATTYVNDRQETANSLAAINVTATSQGAQITDLASWKDTTYVNDRQVVNEALAAINATANAQGATIESVTTWKSTTYVNDRQEVTAALAAINQTVSNQGASIGAFTHWYEVTYPNDQKQLREAVTAIEQSVSAQGASITALAGYTTETVSTFTDALAQMNATANAQGAQITTLTTWVNETYVCDRRQTNESLAAINQTVNSQGAEINSLTTWKATTYANDKETTQEALAAINQTVSSHGASISTLTEWKSSATTAIASAWNTANEAGAAAGYVVEKTTNGHKLKASIVIEAINNESTAHISADRINFEGFTTFVRPSDLQGGGSVTTINGGLITTETIDVGSIKKSTVTNGSRAVVFDAGIQTSYVRTNDITATGQLNLGATLVAVGSALTVNGKSVLVEGDVDLTGYATQTWSNNAFAVKDHIHSGYLNTTSANADTLVVKKVGSTDGYNIALVGHGHSNYALSNHTHEGMATQSWANGAFASLGHTHAGTMTFKSANTNTVVLSAVGDTTQYNLATAAHTHAGMATQTWVSEGFASAGHSHTGMATQDWVNGAFSSSGHTHAGMLIFSTANTTTLVVTSDGSTTKRNIALIGHGHSNYSLSDHGHSNYAASDHTHEGMATQTWANNTFALTGHTHTGLLNLKSANTTAIVFTLEGDTTQYKAAAVGHGHANYAASDHTHSEYALSTHGHSNYAACDHTHTDTLTFSSTTGANVVVGKVGSTATYTIALANHTHSGYAASDHTHAGMFSFSATAGTNLTMARAGSTTTYVVALANHTHTDLVTTDLMKFSSTTGAELKLSRVGSTTSYTVALANHTHTGYASSDHNHTDYFKFNSTAGTNLNMAKIGTTTTYYNVALANHTHSGLISSADLSGHLSYSSVSGTTLVATSVGSTTKINIALANHTHDFSTTDHMKFKSTTGANVTLTRLGATTNTDYTFSLANHTHTGYISTADLSKYISSSDLSGYLVYSSTSGSKLILTSGTTTKINVALANHTHDTDIVDHMLFGSTVGTNITLKRIGAYSNTDYTFSLANHTHTGMEVNYANLLQVVNTNATTGVVNAKYVSYTTYGTSSTVSLSLALWSSNSGGGGSTVDFMKFSSTTGANITLTKIGSYSNANYTFSLANHTHSSYVSTGDLNGKWYVNINGTKYYLRSP